MFNSDSRTKNVARTSFSGVSSNVINIILGFVYRTIFLHILSSSYLGINGLFTNVLAILSFAELGITNPIVFRLYAPISSNDVNKVGRLMCFLKRVYRIIALAIVVAGLLFMPFIDFLIKDPGEIPGDVNLNTVYLLFLLQTASSYLFVYKQNILSADQRQDVLSGFSIAVSFLRYLFQVIILIITKSYVLTLTVGIIWTILTNIIISEWVSRRYRAVFCVTESISGDEKKAIYEDAGASLCHKIGGTVLTSTDNILISKFVGIVTTGIFSNYSLIFSGLASMMSQLLGSFTSSLGNAHVEQSSEQKYISYRRLLFADLWITSVFTVCMYSLIDEFIYIWIGEDMLLSSLTVAVLSAQFFLENSRVVSTSYTFGCGLFIKDKLRPFIESIINLAVSIYCVIHIGIAGVFIGTIVSHLCTVTWREPYLLYKYEFKTGFVNYWIYYIPACVGTLLLCMVYGYVFSLPAFEVTGLLAWILKALTVFVSSNLIAALVFCRNKDFRFYMNLIAGKLKKST